MLCTSPTASSVVHVYAEEAWIRCLSHALTWPPNHPTPLGMLLELAYVVHG